MCFSRFGVFRVMNYLIFMFSFRRKFYVNVFEVTFNYIHVKKKKGSFITYVQ